MLISEGWEVAERVPPGRDLLFPGGGERDWVSAQVPGHVHLDLVRAGVIGDPFFRKQERSCQWVDEADWTYRTTFTVDAARLASQGEHGRHFLHFHGLDTLARVFLNGALVGSAENFFLAHRFDVTDALKAGANELRVEFDSALRVGRERASVYLGDGSSKRGAGSYFNFGPRAFVRKPQYMFGWDWGPELVSCGIWQPVELITVPVAQIVDWRYDYDITDANRAEVTVIVTVERFDPAALVRLAASHLPQAGPELFSDVPAGAGRHEITLSLPITWVVKWPGGAAEGPVTYQLILRLAGEQSADGTAALGEVRGVIGFRTIELIREPDADGKGESFKFRVNGVDTFIKGANWIPDHSFPAAVTKERLRERLTQAQGAGFNMLRVWGGGLYETEDFYNLCDELGILVWQDFPFACSMYPDDLPPFVEAVRAEATAAVKRIRNHPCLALWCGGNENLQLFEGRWAGKTQATQFFGDTLIHNTLPAVVAAHDPRTPYWPNSPYGGPAAQSDDYGDAHYWRVWHSQGGSTGDWHYQENDCRFSSEFGFAAPAGHIAWEEATLPSDRSVRSPVSRWHDKTRKGYETYLGYIARHFPDPQTFDDLIYYGQANQAEALKFGVEHWRRRKGRCWGTLFWQFNDCWPAHSWAVVDSSGQPKAAFYAAKRFYAPLLLSLRRTTVDDNEGDARIEAFLTSDLLGQTSGTLTLRLLGVDGTEVLREERRVIAPANAASPPLTALVFDAETFRLDTFVHATFTSASGEVLAENFLLLAEPKELRLPDPGLGWEITADTITIWAERFAGYVWLHVPGTKVAFSDNWFHLAPGQTRTVALGGVPADLFGDALQARLKVRHL